MKLCPKIRKIRDMTKPWLGKVGASFQKKLKEVVSVTFDTTSFMVCFISPSNSSFARGRHFIRILPF